jgi:hypothetical protein
MSRQNDLHAANRAKKDEFYTALTDIEKEMKNYRSQFKNKIIFCNCDDPETSMFWRYFQLNFQVLGIKKLIATHFDSSEPSYKLELVSDITNDGIIDNADIIKTPLTCNGDFRSPECIEILKEADIICTNPPFSLFREFMAQLTQYKKSFIIIGNVNAITYKEVFPLIQSGSIWLGQSIHSGDREFMVPEDYPLTAASCRTDENGNKYIRVKGVRWFTNMDYAERHENLILYKKYTNIEYPNLDNYHAININKTADIPEDYMDVMAVPITFMDKWSPEQFTIVGRADANIANEGNVYHIDGFKDKGGAPMVNGKFLYKRILIKRRDAENENSDA